MLKKLMIKNDDKNDNKKVNDKNWKIKEDM